MIESSTRISPLSLAAFEHDAAGYDAAVRASTDVDGFCSQSAFVISAMSGLQPGRSPQLFRVEFPDDDANGYLVFAERSAALFGDPRPRRLWEPLEAMWGLGAPVIGQDPIRLGAALAAVLAEEGRGAIVLLCGLRPDSVRLAALAAALAPTHRLVQGSSTFRQVASLADGTDGFLSRRSPRFRANLRRALRTSETRGIVHERYAPSDLPTVTRLYDRATAIDDRSWKGRADAGLRGSGLHAFYAAMLPRLAARGSLRMSFLVDGESDVAYLFGGVFGDCFRGLQFAFASGHEAASLGNLAQYYEIAALCQEGVTVYDLGTAVDYKRHWGERLDETVSIIASPRSTA